MKQPTQLQSAPLDNVRLGYMYTNNPTHVLCENLSSCSCTRARTFGSTRRHFWICFATDACGGVGGTCCNKDQYADVQLFSIEGAHCHELVSSDNTTDCFKTFWGSHGYQYASYKAGLCPPHFNRVFYCNDYINVQLVERTLKFVCLVNQTSRLLTPILGHIF